MDVRVMVDIYYLTQLLFESWMVNRVAVIIILLYSTDHVKNIGSSASQLQDVRIAPQCPYQTNGVSQL